MRTLQVATEHRLVDNIRIASPCPASWADMLGNDVRRFCQQCAKSVYNLEALTAAEAEQLIRENEGSLCVRLYRRRDGTVLTADCPLGLAERAFLGSRRLSIAMAASVVAAVALVGAWLLLVPARVGASTPPIVEGREGGSLVTGLSYGERVLSAQRRLETKWNRSFDAGGV